VSERQHLTADALRVYGRIARQESLADVKQEHLDELEEWGLIGFDPACPGTPVVLDPHTALQRKLAQELKEAQARVARMSALPSLADELGTHFAGAQWRTGGGAEYLDDPATVNARLDAVVAGARVEILAGQPGGPRTADLLALAIDRDTAALERGVRLRTLYRDTVRDSALTAEQARVMTGKGAEYRTLVGHFERCIVVDRRHAFISNYVVEGAPQHSAWHVSDRAMVAWIAEVFDGEWRRADVWSGELRPRRGEPAVDTVSAPAAPGVRTTRRQREILRDLAAGHTQPAIARRIGVSKRKLEEDIAALKALWGAGTLPELVYQWALSPDRLVDDSAPTTGDVAGAGLAGAIGVETAA
jgi:DNA-binding CsgD family transcriptional regulator